MTAATLQTALQESAAKVEALLARLLPASNKEKERTLYEAMRYGCLEGGKRLRPFLMLNAASLFGVDEARALRVAAAIEAAHCYSLIHDDLPCMDNADLRRGKPTVHRAFDEVTAVLAGDALQALAFDILAHEDTHTDARVRVQLVQGLARALGAHGMVGGQVLDLIGEKEALPLGAITRMQRMKTGALFTFCCEAGGVMGRASSKHMLALRNYASDFGLAFQLTDDLLDKHGVVAQTGKDVGKDVRKSTFVRILGPEEARKKAEILIAQAIEHLGVFGPRAQNLVDLAQFVLDRKG